MPASRRSAPIQPSDLEMQILAVLWDRGPATAREVLESLPDGKQRAYTSVLSVMQVMQKKKLVKVTDRRGLAHIYKPVVSRKQVLAPMLRGMVQQLFAGSPSAAVEQLLDASKLTDDELSEIRRLVDAAKSASKKSNSGK